MPSLDYEVAIVGAGPAGSVAAGGLASRGHEVALVDENQGPRQSIICSGIVGREAFEAFHLPRHAIVDTIRQARFVSPSGRVVHYSPRKPMAYVVNRSRFDGGLASFAKDRGARILWGHRVESVRRTKAGLELSLRASGRLLTLHVRAVVIATGYRRSFHAALGLGMPQRYIHGIHTELASSDLDSADLYFGSDVSPGFFGWVVPYGTRRARVGLLAQANGRRLFGRFLKTRAVGPRLEAEPIQAAHLSRGIVQGFVQPSFSERALAVGEAAGQMKTTTGGGIYYGMIGGEIAADVLSFSLRGNRLSADHLSRYERAWHRRLGGEIRSGLALQRLGRGMDDRSIDQLFVSLQDGLGSAIRKVLHFDWHRPCSSLLLRHERAGVGLLRRFLVEGWEG